MARPTLSPHMIVAMVLLTLATATLSEAARPARTPVTVVENFDDPADAGPVDRLVIGTKNATATLDGGEIASQAWVFPGGVQGTIDWKKAASKVSFTASLNGGVGFVYLLGRRDEVLTRLTIESVEKRFSFESEAGVHSAMIVHLGSTIVIDDLEYTVP